jgi:hypothetical protein
VTPIVALVPPTPSTEAQATESCSKGASRFQNSICPLTDETLEQLVPTTVPEGTSAESLEGTSAGSLLTFYMHMRSLSKAITPTDFYGQCHAM